VKKLLLPTFLLLLATPIGAQTPALRDHVATVEALLPVKPEDCTKARSDQLAAAAIALETWAAELALPGAPTRDPNQRIAQGIARIRQLASAQHRIDQGLERVLALRTQFVAIPESDARREMLRRYLEMTTEGIDLSGRMRYLLNDGLGQASYEASARPEQVLDVLLEHRSDVGALVMSYLLFDPPPGSAARPVSQTVKRKVLELMAVGRRSTFLGTLAEFVRDPESSPELVIYASNVIREIGLPQDPDPTQDKDLPTPEITATELFAVLAAIDGKRLSPAASRQRDVLLEWLTHRTRNGVAGNRFRTNGFDLQPGDWLLMRNPRPYNLFTDLSPGLFTHVGIVTTVEDSNGVRRFVIVEMPERRGEIPATNIDAYLKRTLYYFFMRHEDPKVAQQMSEVARSVIGNPTQFDLTFDNQHVFALKGQDLTDKRIHTYCAGFLLLCAQATSAPREEFFPIPERPAEGFCMENFAKLRLSLGEDFVSPTSCIFSPNLALVGRREPFYEATREIKEKIFDVFAQYMRERQLTPSPTIYQSLRQTLAGMSKDRPWLAQFLAETNNVSQYTDLDAAARAAAVVESLDNIADASAAEFIHARDALMAEPTEQLRKQGVQQGELKRIEEYRARHSQLYAQWRDLRLTPRELRIALVDYYADKGRQKLEERFFPK
jgi:uncharacterized damage-inducible protein DinB